MASNNQTFVPKFSVASRFAYMGNEGKQFNGYDFCIVSQKGTHKRYEVHPPPPVLVGKSDVHAIPTTCYHATPFCMNKGKYQKEFGGKWYCGKHLSKQCRKFEYKARHKHAKQMCAVCHEDIELTDEVATTQCGHSFHRECLAQWNTRKFNCPVCRMGVYEHNPEARRLVHDNLLVENLFLISKTLEGQLVIGRDCMTYLEKRFERSVMWQDKVEFIKRTLTVDARLTMLEKVLDSVNEDIVKAIY